MVSSYRLTKQAKMIKTDDFSSVFSFRRAIRGSTFLLHYRPRETGHADSARLGLVIAKRNLRRSVDRNLIRRLIREVFRTRRPGLPPCDLIVRLAVKLPLPLDRKALVGEVARLLDKLRTTGR